MNRTLITRANGVVSDVRDRVHADLSQLVLPEAPLSTYLGALTEEIEAAAVAGNEPHHVDATVSTDARECLLRISALAAVAVADLDQRALAARQEPSHA